MVCDFRLVSVSFDPVAEFSAFNSKLSDQGAAVTFVGFARPQTKAGKKIDHLLLEYHPRLTQRSLENIGKDAQSRFGISAICIVHRHGMISPGEAIVFVAAADLNRRAAFEAAEYAMDRLKTEAVFWKKEVAEEESHWIEPTMIDHSDRARWG